MKNLVPLPEVAEKVVLTVEIACASSTKLAGTEFLITEKLGIPLEDVVEMRYRDGEYPGEFAVTTRDGQRKALPFFEVVDEFKRFKTHRCLVCGDWWSGIADVSISDGDPNIYASSQSGARPPRQSIVMTRTKEGEKAVQAAVATRACHGHAQGFRFRGKSRAAAQAIPLRLVRRGDAGPGSHAAGRLPGNRDAAERHGGHQPHVVPHADHAEPSGGRRRAAVQEPPSPSVSTWQAPARSCGAHPATRRSPSAPHSRPLSRMGRAASTMFPIRTTSKAISAFSVSSGSTSGRPLTRPYVIGGRGLRGLKSVAEGIDFEPRQLGDDRAHPDGPPRRHARANFASTATSCCASGR